MKILITGSGGLIGGFLLASLSRDGHSVVGTYRNTKPRIPHPPSDSVRLIRLDLSESLEDLEPVDAIIHAAAHTPLIPDSTASDYIHSNAIATLNLAEYAKVIRPEIFVYLSTVSAYGEIGVRELGEETPLNSPEMYGLSKYMCELILKEYADHFSSICIRLPGIVGRGYFTPWLGSVLVKASKNNPIQIYNSNALFNNVVDLLEIHRFISHILDREFRGFDYINLAASDPIKIREMVDLIVSLTDSKSEILERDSHKQSFSIKTEKIRLIFGFEPETTEAIIRRYVTENISSLRGCEGNV